MAEPSTKEEKKISFLSATIDMIDDNLRFKIEGLKVFLNAR